MELFFFIVLLLAGIVLTALGLRQGNFPMTLVACVLLMGFGGLVLSEGLSTQKLVGYEINDLNADVPISITPTYETFTSVSNVEIGVLGWLLMGGGFITLLFSAYYSMFGGTGEPDEMGGV